MAKKILKLDYKEEFDRLDPPQELWEDVQHGVATRHEETGEQA